MNNLPFDLPFEIPEVKEQYLPYAYVLIGIGVLIIVKKPTTILSLLSSYYTIRNLVAEGKMKLNP